MKKCKLCDTVITKDEQGVYKDGSRCEIYCGTCFNKGEFTTIGKLFLKRKLHDHCVNMRK